MPGAITSANFSFLKVHDAQLVCLGALAERYFQDDPNTCLIKLRQFGDLLAQIAAVKVGLFEGEQEGRAELLRRLRLEGVTLNEVKELFHHLNNEGVPTLSGRGHWQKETVVNLLAQVDKASGAIRSDTAST